MKYISELPALMVELMENVEEQGEDLKFTQRASEIVKEISAYAKTTNFYKRSQEVAENFWKEGTKPKEIYCYILSLVVNAPTDLHRDVSVLGHMPALEKAISEYEEETPC